MQVKLRVPNILLVCLWVVVGGCASTGGLVTSLEDLTTESSKEGWVKVPQYRVLSVPGILPFADAGSLQFYKPKRKPSSAVGLSNGNSYIMQSVIKPECCVACLIKIRDGLLDLRAKAEAFVEAKINLTKIAASPAPDESAKTKIALPPPNGPETVKGALPLSSGAETTKADSYAAAKGKFDKAREALDTTHQNVVKSINLNGILIYRWDSTSERKGSLGLGDIFGTSGSKNESYSGFALVSGLRTATLFVGSDIVKAWKDLNTKSIYSNRFEVTTHVMQAKYILYISEYDLQGVINAKLKASYAQLSNLPEAIKDLDRIEIEAALSKVANLSNMGVIGKSVRTKRDVDWTKPAGISDFSSLDGWQTFFSVETDLTDLLDMLSKKSVQ